MLSDSSTPLDDQVALIQEMIMLRKEMQFPEIANLF